MALPVEAAAGPTERELVGEVTVDAEPTHARSVGDIGHRRPRHADALVQCDRGFDDPLPCFVLALGPPLEGVASCHVVHSTWCSPNLTTAVWSSTVLSLSQNILFCKIAEGANMDPTHGVTEIGPGPVPAIHLRARFRPPSSITFSSMTTSPCCITPGSRGCSRR